MTGQYQSSVLGDLPEASTTTPVATPRVIAAINENTRAGILECVPIGPIKRRRYLRDTVNLNGNDPQTVFCTPTSLTSCISVPVPPAMPEFHGLQLQSDFDRPSLIAPRTGLGRSKPTLRPKVVVEHSRGALASVGCLLTQEAAVRSSSDEGRDRFSASFINDLPKMPDESSMRKGGRRCGTLKPRLSH